MEKKNNRELSKIELNVWAYLNEIDDSLNQEEINLKRVFYLIDMARAILTGNEKSDFGD